MASSNIQINKSKLGVDSNSVPMSINPYDQVAMEELLNLKEKGVISSIYTVAIGEEYQTKALNHVVSMGADKAIYVQCHNNFRQISISNAVKSLIEKYEINIFACADKTIESDEIIFPYMLADALDWQSYQSCIGFSVDGKIVTLDRVYGNGIVKVQAEFPSIITVGDTKKKPREVTVLDMLKAKKHTITRYDIEELIEAECSSPVKYELLPQTKRDSLNHRVYDLSVIAELLLEEY